MEDQSIFRHIEAEIDGVEYKATYFLEEEVLQVAINGKAYMRVATPEIAEATVRAMMVEEALSDSLKSRN